MIGKKGATTDQDSQPQTDALQVRYAEAAKRVEDHVQLMKRRENEFADQREISALQRRLAVLLSEWAGLKQAKGQHDGKS